MGRERFELSTFRLSAERSSQAELPAHNAQPVKIEISQANYKHCSENWTLDDLLTLAGSFSTIESENAHQKLFNHLRAILSVGP